MPGNPDAGEEDKYSSCESDTLRDTPGDNDEIRIAVNPSRDWRRRLGASWEFGLCVYGLYDFVHLAEY
jgi:hypothetical protein